MIEIHNLTKSFKDNVVFENACSSFGDNRISVLLGANGSGKTTLMKILSTLVRADSGEIIVDGMDMNKNQTYIRNKIGVLLGGDANLYNRLTGRENIKYFAQLQGVPAKKIDSLIDDFKKIIDIENCLDQPVGIFSRGMRQKIALIKTIIHSPDILLLDEPTTGLDIYSIRDVENFIKKYRETGKIIILSTHNMHEADTLADDICIIKNKKLEFVNRSSCDSRNAFSTMDLFFEIMGDKND